MNWRRVLLWIVDALLRPLEWAHRKLDASITKETKEPQS